MWDTKEDPGITMVTYQADDHITRIKTRMEIGHETGKDLTQQEYDNIKIATTYMLRDYGLSWETLRYSKM